MAEEPEKESDPPHSSPTFLDRALFHLSDAGLYRPAGAAGLLNHQPPQHGTGGQAGFLEESVDVVGLTAQSAHQRAGHIGISDVSRQDAPQVGHGSPGFLQTAARGSDKGNHRIHIWIVPQHRLGKVICNFPGHCGGAVAAHDHCNAVAGSHLPVLPHIAQKGAPLCWWNQLHRAVVHAERSVLGHRVKVDGVVVHMCAGLHITGGVADYRIVFQYGLPFPDGPGGDFMAQRDI